MRMKKENSMVKRAIGYGVDTAISGAILAGLIEVTNAGSNIDEMLAGESYERWLDYGDWDTYAGLGAGGFLLATVLRFFFHAALLKGARYGFREGVKWATPPEDSK